MKDNHAQILKEFVNACGEDKDAFLYSNKVLMAIVHICITNSDKHGNKANGATCDEVIKTLNSFNITDKDFDTNKTSYKTSDAPEICLHLSTLINNNLVGVDLNDIDHVKPTAMGYALGMANFDIIKPLQYSKVYEYYAQIKDSATMQKNFMNN